MSAQSLKKGGRNHSKSCPLFHFDCSVHLLVDHCTIMHHAVDFDIMNSGYLIQARESDSDKFVAGSNIVGDWLLDPSNPRYRILECGRNINAPTPVFPVSGN